MSLRYPFLTGVRLAAIAVVLPLLAVRAPRAQAQSGNVPPEASALIVKVHGYFGETPELGAGIVVGLSAQNVWIATAKHVVRRGTQVAEVWVFSPSSSRDSIRATVVRTTEADRLGRDLDIAVISIPGTSASRLMSQRLEFNRRGNPRSVRIGDPVYPVGCPQDACGAAPSPADRVVSNDGEMIAFHSSFVGPGSSGGALFNAWWEVVGMVVRDQPPLGEAISIETVLRTAARWEVPTRLKRPFVPRAGYRTSVGVAFLLPTASSQDPFPEGRVPSGRVTLTHQALPALNWHVGGLRLAPENMTVSAVMLGLGAHLKVGRFAFRPFVEAGFGRAEARFDIGGAFVEGPDPDAYVPVWDRVERDGVGGGVGLSIELLILPRTILEVVGGYWDFSAPEMPGVDERFIPAPTLPNFFVGSGLRMGL